MNDPLSYKANKSQSKSENSIEKKQTDQSYYISYVNI